jgi:hypothetical protein
MKLAIRIAALSVVFAGVAAASVSSTATKQGVLTSSQAATARMPVPLCAPGLPTCPNNPVPPQQ